MTTATYATVDEKKAEYVDAECRRFAEAHGITEGGARLLAAELLRGVDQDDVRAHLAIARRNFCETLGLWARAISD